MQVLVLVSCKTRRRSTTTLSPPWSHDSPGELGSTNEKGGTRRSSTNERRRHRTPSTSTSTTTSSTEPPSRLPALEEKVITTTAMKCFAYFTSNWRLVTLWRTGKLTNSNHEPIWSLGCLASSRAGGNIGRCAWLLGRGETWQNNHHCPPCHCCRWSSTSSPLCKDNTKVGSMGALFLLVLMTQRFFCRRNREDKKEVR